MKESKYIVALAAVLLIVAVVNFANIEPSHVTERIDPGPSGPSEVVPGSPAGADKSMPDDHDLLVQISQLRDLLAEKPDDLEHIIRLANLLFDRGDFPEAAQWYEKALVRQPENVPVRIDYAVCLFNTGDGEDALVNLNHALSLDPKNLVGLYNLGVISNASGKPDQARVAWEKVVSIDPESAIGQKARSGLQSLQR